MGYEAVDLHATAILSRHNAPQDTRDNTLWNDFLDRVRALARDPKYDPILLDVDGDRRES